MKAGYSEHFQCVKLLSSAFARSLNAREILESFSGKHGNCAVIRNFTKVWMPHGSGKCREQLNRLLESHLFRHSMAFHSGCSLGSPPGFEVVVAHQLLLENRTEGVGRDRIFGGLEESSDMKMNIN